MQEPTKNELRIASEMRCRIADLLSAAPEQRESAVRALLLHAMMQSRTDSEDRQFDRQLWLRVYAAGLVYIAAGWLALALICVWSK